MRIKKFFSFIFILLFTFSVPRASGISFSKCRLLFRFFYCCSGKQSCYDSIDEGHQDISTLKNTMAYRDLKKDDTNKDPESEHDSGLGSAPPSSVSGEDEESEVNLFFKEQNYQADSSVIVGVNEINDDDSDDEAYDKDKKNIFYKKDMNNKKWTAQNISPSAIMERNFFILTASKTNVIFPTRKLWAIEEIPE